MHRFVADMYRVARHSQEGEFKTWALRQSCDLEQLHSASWVNGSIQGGIPVFHDASTVGLAPGYWETMQSLAAIDPLGPRMFASPATSFLTGHNDFPQAIVEQVMIAFGVSTAISGMISSPHTGIFSVVCWHRDASRPAFSAAQRELHERLLPHWIECLSINRLTNALSDLESLARSGYLAALSDSDGLLQYAQRGFGELLQREFPSWSGSLLPAIIADHIGASKEQHLQGQQIVADWRPTRGGLTLLHIRLKSPFDTLSPREHEVTNLLVRGLSIKEVARQLGISPSTVDNIRAAAYLKLGVRNRTELVRRIESRTL